MTVVLVNDFPSMKTSCFPSVRPSASLSVYLFVSLRGCLLFLRMNACLPACLFVCLSACFSVCLYVRPSLPRILKVYINVDTCT